MATQYMFERKAIKCNLWTEMLHLAKLAIDQGYIVANTNDFKEEDFKKGYIFFHVTSIPIKCILNMRDAGINDVAISYDDFIASPDVVKEELPIEIVELTGCGECLFHESRMPFQHMCNHPKYEQPIFAKTSIKKLFKTCPLKEKSLTIKLKTGDIPEQKEQQAIPKAPES